jgi:hypothetical protein
MNGTLLRIGLASRDDAPGAPRVPNLQRFRPHGSRWLQVNPSSAAGYLRK